MCLPSLTINDVNSLASNDFIQVFGNVVEHYPAAAIGILKNRPFNTASDITNALSAYLDCLSNNEKEKILLLHPDLGTTKPLTKDSSEEQKYAGLHQISNENKEKLQHLNEKYKEKFGFPFVICSKDNKINSILQELEERIGNDKNDELINGIEEVKKICSLRIKTIVHE